MDNLFPATPQHAVEKLSLTGNTTREPIDFLDLVGHELKQPLTAARGCLGLLLERGDRIDEPTRISLLETSIRNLDQLSALIGSLRLFSDTDQGRLHPTVKLVSVEELFNDAVEDFPDARTERKLIADCAPGLQIRVDQDLFKQVLANLLSNAVKFGPPGSVITLEAHSSNGDVIITVKDEGDGFAEKDNERMFDKSVQLTKGGKGLGLGLFVAREIVEAHRGQISAASESGEGAAFAVSIPA
ncbi:MAG: two-component system, OmpR family, sensor histidine kinase KdpD [Actinomycetota bacterium]|nr:two-component system, OmpR family, sensor histidine kinase KdpD [Actinomycetota bacterium]